MAGSITLVVVAPHRQPPPRRLGYRLSSRGNSICVTCTYRISVPKVGVGESLFPAGASRLGNGEVLQRNKHLYGRILGGKGPEHENRKSENRKSIIC